MIGLYSKYGALDTKVRAMYGKRLRAADLRRVAALGTLAEVRDFLQGHPGWAGIADRLPRERLDRAAMEAALRDCVRADYLRLSVFLPGGDRSLASFPVLLAEQEALLMTLRRLRTGGGTVVPSQFLARSRLSPEALADCRDFSGLAAAAEGTIYHRALLRLQPDRSDALPDFLTTESLLRSAYFGTIYRLIHRHYAGETKSVLLKSFGVQVDLLNIIHILRLKHYFPQSDMVFTVLFPFHDKLKPAMTRALAEAPDAETCFALLRDTPYADCFSVRAVTEVEDYYRRAFYRFNRRQLILAPPSVYSAVAYLNLRELELKALITAIESASYGTVYDDSFAELLG